MFILTVLFEMCSNLSGFFDCFWEEDREPIQVAKVTKTYGSLAFTHLGSSLILTLLMAPSPGDALLGSVSHILPPPPLQAPFSAPKTPHIFWHLPSSSPAIFSTCFYPQLHSISLGGPITAMVSTWATMSMNPKSWY